MTAPARPDPARELARLKDFQRATVEHVHRRLWLDEDRTSRFLVADEVGLGKTLVARGVIAATLDHLWDTEDRLDIVYICSNTQIARQNLARLRSGVGHTDHADRLTMLPQVISQLERRKVNFVSFTPGTSFDIGRSGGRVEERVLLYWLLAAAWGRDAVRSRRWVNFFRGGVALGVFDARLAAFRRSSISESVAASFAADVADCPGTTGGSLTEELAACAEEFRYARTRVEHDLSRRRYRLIGRLRTLVAHAAVRALAPDLIILDEFQRFRQLLDTDADEAGLARALFDQPSAKILLLSATPFKMYTLPDEPEGDDHYRDFMATVRFLAAGSTSAVVVSPDDVAHDLRTMRNAMLSGQADAASDARDRVETGLRKLMSRVERTGSTTDRDGMLRESTMAGVTLAPADVAAFRSIDAIARIVDRHDVFEYWRSAPYLLNLMDSYQVKKKLRAHAGRNEPPLRTALREASGLLDWESVRHYEALDPGNAKMRGLVHDVLDRGAWKLAWLPPSMAYYSPAGAFADSDLQRLTKRLVFSAWAVVPKAIAVVLSYEAERRGVAAAASDRTYDGTRPAALLRFQLGASGHPAGMSALGLLYPCAALAQLGDPLELTRALGHRFPAGREDLLAEAERRVAAHLATLPDPTSETRVDPQWYWAAPMLLDQALLGPAHDAFLRRIAGSDHDEDGDGDGDGDQQSRFGDHVRAAQTVDPSSLGRRPDDLAVVLARMAVAGPGVCALRALSRSCGGTSGLTDPELRETALSVASGLRSLFNRPVISTLLRAGSDESYWLNVLDHCLDGNLQAVLDEYLLVLAESESLQGLSATARAEGLRTTATSALRVRTTSPHVDDIRVSDSSIDITVRTARTHFAVPYGRGPAEDSSTIQRASDVRTAFNSPFWPFVLASTSVGQEGLDFHHYCHAVVHWNLPGNPVDLEQREGRVHRYKGHAIRKNVAATHSDAALRTTSDDPWQAMFAAAHDNRVDGTNDLTPFWMYPVDGGAAIDRYVPAMPLSKESQRYQRLLRTVAAYRLVLGQPRQEDLLRYLGGSTTADLDKLRIDLAPPAPTGLFDRSRTAVVVPDDEEEERPVTIRNTAERGIDHVIAELRSRGADAGRVPASRRNEVLVRRTDGTAVTVRVKTRTGGTWQGTINDGDPEPVRDPGRFVVFVDLADHPATCYVAPDWWFQRDVHRDHSAYLARHPGPRPSTHHAIQLSRIVAWRERWDLLGLGEQQ